MTSSVSAQAARVVLLTGGAWWSGSSVNNLGHQYLLQVVRTVTSPNPRPTAPLRVYICTRKPPPPRELDLFVLRNATKTNAGTSNEVEGVDDAVLERIKLRHIPLDLASLQSIKQCAVSFLEQENRLDILLLNAAIAPKDRKLTDVELDGERIEEALMTNVLGHAMLFKLLKNAINNTGSSDDVRVVTVSSELHRKLGKDEVTPQTLPDLLGPTEWQGMRAYQISKLLQTYWSFALPEELPANVRSIAVSPGFVPSTGLSRNCPKLLQLFMSYLLHYAPFASTPAEGGKKLFNACFGKEGSWSTEASKISPNEGVYLKDYKDTPAADEIYDTAMRKQWKAWIDHTVDRILAG